VYRFETCGRPGKFKICVYDLDGQLSDLTEFAAGHLFSARAPDRVVHLTPIDDRHQQGAFRFRSFAEQILDRSSADAILEECHQSAGVKDVGFHRTGSLLRSSIN